MALIPFYVTTTRQGFKTIATVNPTAATVRHLRPLDGVLAILRYDMRRPPLLYVLQYAAEGVLLSVLRPCHDDATAYRAASFFLAAGIQVPSGRLSALCAAAVDIVSTADDPDSEALADIRRLLAEDFPVAADAPRLSPSSGHSYAYARIDGTDTSTFDDYAAQGFYQPEFAAYAGVVLFRSSDGVIGLAHARDLSRHTPIKMVSLLPPGNTSTGFAPTCYHRPFTSPILFERGQTAVIEWRRAGYEPLVQEIVVSSPGMTPTMPDTSHARRFLTPSMFFITEQGTTHPVQQYVITVNGRVIDRQEMFNYSELQSARVRISAPGYFTFTGTLDLATAGEAMVQLRRLHNIYRFDLPLVTPDPAEAIRLYLKTQKDLTDSPVEGYAVVGDITEGIDHPNRLIYTGDRRRRDLLTLVITAAAALVAGVVIGWMAFSVDNSETVPEAEAVHASGSGLGAAVAAANDSAANDTMPAPANTVSAVPADMSEPSPSEASPAAEPDYAAAARYMTDNKNWSRDQLEAIPGMAGFFDDLNTYNFNRILTYWEPLLSGRSAQFDAVVRACRGSAGKRDPRCDRHAPVYSSDGSINWRMYTFWVDP